MATLTYESRQLVKLALDSIARERNAGFMPGDMTLPREHDREISLVPAGVHRIPPRAGKVRLHDLRHGLSPVIGSVPTRHVDRARTVAHPDVLIFQRCIDHPTSCVTIDGKRVGVCEAGHVDRFVATRSIDDYLAPRSTRKARQARQATQAAAAAQQAKRDYLLSLLARAGNASESD